MGHIELAAPVAHIWFLKSLPSRIGLLLDMPLKHLERVLYFESYIVIEPGLTACKEKSAPDRGRLLDAQDEYGADAFTAGIGAEAIREMLSSDRSAKTREELRAGARRSHQAELKPKKIIKRLKVVEASSNRATGRNG